jgi:hypothetical protein
LIVGGRERERDGSGDSAEERLELVLLELDELRLV